MSDRKSRRPETEEEAAKTCFSQIKGVFADNNTNYKSYSALRRVYLEKIDLKKHQEEIVL